MTDEVKDIEINQEEAVEAEITHPSLLTRCSIKFQDFECREKVAASSSQ